jgi:uncharacterized protein YchJ
VTDVIGSMMKNDMSQSARCWCGSARPFESCCGPLLEGRTRAVTAEQLMRSRYTAYVLSDADYLLRTWHAGTRPSSIQFEPHQRWLGLKIKSTELSQFLNTPEGWVYVEGTQLDRQRSGKGTNMRSAQE